MLRAHQNGDLEKIKLQPEQELEKSEAWKNFENSKTLVFSDNDKVLALFLPIEEHGTISLFALIGKDCGYKSVSMFKEMRSWIDKQLQRPDINRIDFTTQSNFEQANRLANLLGFTCEGTLHKVFKGIDFNVWGKFK